jgi:ribonuclease HI
MEKQLMREPTRHQSVRRELYFDGAPIGNPGPAGYGYVIRCGESVYKGSGYIGEATNNVAEYTGLIEGLKRFLELGCRDLVIFSDSELVVRQLRDEYRVRSRGILPLYRAPSELMGRFGSVEVQHVCREDYGCVVKAILSRDGW